MRNLESKKESGAPSQEPSGDVGGKESEKEGDEVSVLREKLKRAKEQKAEQEKAKKEEALQKKIETQARLAEEKERQNEQLDKVRELLKQVEDDLDAARENLQKAGAKLEEAQGILKEYLDVAGDSEEAKSGKKEIEKIMGEMEQTYQGIKEQIAVLEKRRDELVSQIEAFSQAIQRLEVDIEEIASNPEVAERLKEIAKEKAEAEEKEKERTKEEITRAQQEIKEGCQGLFEKVQKLAESIEHAKSMQRFAEKKLREIRPGAEKFLFSYSWWDKAGKELKTEAQGIFQRSDSPEEFAKGLSDLRKNKYSGFGKGKAKKAIDYALDLIQHHRDFQEWRDWLKGLELWQTEAQFPKDAVAELALEYSTLICAAWEVKRNYQKEGERLPFEVYWALQNKMEERVKGLNDSLDRTRKGGEGWRYDIPELEKRTKDKTDALKAIVHAVIKEGGDIYHDPREK